MMPVNMMYPMALSITKTFPPFGLSGGVTAWAHHVYTVSCPLRVVHGVGTHIPNVIYRVGAACLDFFEELPEREHG